MFDLMVRGGVVVDGTGRPGRHADVGIVGDTITEIGEIPADASTRETIDATGRIVAPGFIDVHTHYDAQLFWDAQLTPSTLHGVTTVVAGNCGFSIAPLRGSGGVDYIVQLLSRVEGIPAESLRAGAPWSWTTMAEFLDLLVGRCAANVGVLVGHSAVRRSVMGPAAVERAATEDELDAMCRLVHEAIEAGALGFSSSWTRAHNDADGNMAPSRHAEKPELIALARAAGDHEGTSLEMNPINGLLIQEWAVDLLVDMSVAAGRPINWNLIVADADNLDRCMQALQAGDVAAKRGGKIVGLASSYTAKRFMSFASGFSYDLIPGWERVMGLPRLDKLPLLRDPAFRASLLQLAQRWAHGADDRPWYHWEDLIIFDVVAGENADYPNRRVGDIAEEQGRPAWDVLWDIVLADELLTNFGLPEPPSSDADWDARAQVWADPRALVGGSDAGAHVDMLAGFTYTTNLLGAGVRQHGLVSIEEAVRLLTAAPADLYGLRGRGRLEVGAFADLVVFDADRIGPGEVVSRCDLPAGSARLYSEPQGIDHVVVNGTPIVERGALTDRLPGRVLRAGDDTSTPALS